MRCSKSGRVASAFLLAAIVGLAAPSAAQQRGRSNEADERSENMKMPNVSIEGERQTPDIFFVFPTGKGGNLSAPRMRDYAGDILEPVVKPWFERDQAVNPPAMVTSAEKFDWEKAVGSEPERAPAAAAAPPPPANVAPPPQMPPVGLPPQATQGQLGGSRMYSTGGTASGPSYDPASRANEPTSAYPPTADGSSYPSVPTANQPHYPAGYPAPAAPSYPSSQAPSYPSAPASAPAQIPPQAQSLPQTQSRQIGIPSWAQKPPPDAYQR